MNNIIPFPKRPQNQPEGFKENKKNDPLAPLKKYIQERFNVTLEEHMGSKTDGKRTPETEAKINRALHKETLRLASKFHQLKENEIT